MGFEDEASAFSLVFMFIALFYMGNFQWPGGDYTATFNFGLIPQHFSLSILFFYLGSLVDLFKKNKIILPTIFLSLLILTHAYSAIVGFLGFLGILSANFMIITLKGQKARENGKISSITKIVILALKHLFLTFLLISFWAIPFILEKDYTSLTIIGWETVPIPPITYNLLLISVVLMVITEDDRALTSLMIGLWVLLPFLLSKWNVFFLPVQLYRFVVYPVLFISAPLGVIISFVKKNYDRIEKFLARIIRIKLKKIQFSKFFVIIFFIVFTFATLFHFSSYCKADPRGTLGMNFTLPKLDGRILTIPIHGVGLNPMFHIAPHLVAWSGNEEVGGLFLESTPNAGYITHIKREIDERVGIWGVYPATVTPNKNELLPYHFKYFGINYVLTNLDPEYFRAIFGESIVMKLVDTNSIYGSYYLIKVANNSLIDVLDYIPEKIEGNWHEIQWEWFFDSNKIKKIFTNEEINCSSGEAEKVQVIVKENERIKFYIDSAKEVPIHIKIPYLPNWHAYVNGRETKIYKAPINMMLICGKGEVELKYEPTFYEYVSILLTFIGIAYVIYIQYLREIRVKKI